MLKPTRPSKPSRRQLAGSKRPPDHPLANLRDEAGAFGDGDEGARQPQPIPRVVPAQQRLGPSDFARHQAHLRLESEHELVAQHRFPQRLLGLDFLLVIGGKIAVEQAILPAAGALGAVHRNVGRAHQRLDARAMLGRERNADRGADVDAVRGQFEGFGDGEHDAARDALDLGDRCDLREEDRELVAGEAGEQGTGACAAGELGVDDHPQAVGDHDQQLVAAGMAKAVVDQLEAVEVDEQHRRLAPSSTSLISLSASERKCSRLGSEVTGSYMPSAWAFSIEARTSANRLSTAAATLGMCA